MPDTSDPVDRDDTPPAEVVETAERLTRRSRDAHTDAEAEAYRTDRDERLAEHEYTARVREGETRDVLVLHPAEWVDDGTVRPERVDDVGRGIEIPLSGPDDTADWDVVDAHNRELVAAVREARGDVHAENAATLAEFMSNHYVKPVESATREELEEFLGEYYRRNAWPAEKQRAVVEKSVEFVFDAADEPCPLTGRRR